MIFPQSTVGWFQKQVVSRFRRSLSRWFICSSSQVLCFLGPCSLSAFNYVQLCSRAKFWCWKVRFRSRLNCPKLNLHQCQSPAGLGKLHQRKVTEIHLNPSPESTTNPCSDHLMVCSCLFRCLFSEQHLPTIGVCIKVLACPKWDGSMPSV